MRVYPLATGGVPDWLALIVVVVSVLLAVLTVVLMVARRQPVDHDPAHRPITFDPVLLISAVAVIALAVAAWLSR